MEPKLDAIAASFDARAGTYNQNDWHRHVAEELVAYSGLRSGQAVLDAGTGTGFVAMAAARAVGHQGNVVAVDLSAGMLAVARRHAPDPDWAPITWHQGNAAALPDIPPARFDVVLAAAALLYMPVAAALAEWHRLLKPGGIVGFTTMRAGSPLANQLFRDAGAAAGIPLEDPCGPIGSEAACRALLSRAGFCATAVSTTTVALSGQDVSLAWASNLSSPARTQPCMRSAAMAWRR